MTTTPQTDPATTSTVPGRAAWRDSLRRTSRLSGSNGRLMLRNTTTLLYAFVMPAFPLLLLVLGDEPTPGSGTQLVATTLLMALVFPGYYNLLSAFVTRRDELVLKRLRTGEVRDGEIVASLAAPGAAITLAVLVLTVPIVLVVGLDLPLNPLLLLLGVLVSVVTFAAFALWTAAWTKNAEAAQLTSGPVMLLALGGLVGAAVPERYQPVVDLLPGSAVLDLVGGAWFGRTQDGDTLSFAETWVHLAPAFGVLLGWTVLAVVLARRSLQWEPRV